MRDGILSPGTPRLDTYILARRVRETTPAQCLLLFRSAGSGEKVVIAPVRTIEPPRYDIDRDSGLLFLPNGRLRDASRRSGIGPTMKPLCSRAERYG